MAEVPSIENLISNLQKCRTSKNLQYAKHLHAFACVNGLETHSAVGNHIVPLFVDCNNVPAAQQVFDRLIEHNEHSWTSLISGHAHFGQPHHAFQLYQRMQLNNVYPSTFTFVALLKAFSQLKDAERGKEIHSQIAHKGLEQEAPLGSTLVGMYAKCGLLREAQDVFNELTVQDLATWNSLVSGYAVHGAGDDALIILERMQREGVAPNDFTFSCALKACGNLGALDRGQHVHTEIVEKGHEVDSLIGNTLVSMYSKCCFLSEAEILFDTLLVQDVVSWTAVIGGHVDQGSSEEAINRYEQMQVKGVCPNAITMSCVLKACGNIGSRGKGQEVHTEIVQMGLETDINIGNSLLGMYAKFGLVFDAQVVFEKLSNRDVVSWTALTAGYVENAHLPEVLRCFEEMQLEAIPLDSVMFAGILKACASLKSLEKGRILHKEIFYIGLEGDISVGNSLISLYAKCGELLEAQKVLNKLQGRDEASWAALIAGYAEHGPAVEVLKCLETMRVEGILPGANLFTCSLKACISMGSIVKGQDLHVEIVKYGFDKCPQIGNSLIDMYAKHGSILEAQQLFDGLSVQDVVSWTALIAGYSELECNTKVLNNFEQMQLVRIPANAFTFACVFKACGSLKALEKGQDVHFQAAQEGLEADPFVGSNLIDMYAKCELLKKAQEVFDMLPVRDVVSWTALIAGYIAGGQAHEALKYYEQMHDEGISADAVSLSCCLKACISERAANKGRELHMDVVKKGFDGDIAVGNTLVSFYIQCGLHLDGRSVFTNLSQRNVVSWTSLIAGYAEHGTGQEALSLYLQMKSEGISPHADTYACLLKACGCAGAVQMGQEIHKEILQKGMELDMSVGNSLINMYAKCGSTFEAQSVFERLSEQDAVSWSSIISGYGLKHQGKLAIQYFKSMKEHGVKPDAITFTCLLNACRHGNLVENGQEYFKEMNETFGIEQTMKHISCMVDLFARSGQLYEAERFLKLLPPSEILWAALLSACKTYGEAELGLRCFQKLVELKPNEAAWYVLMEEIYANAGKLDDAYRIEGLRKRLGARKKPAVALIEVAKKVHEFVVGDTQDEKVTKLLEIFSSRMEGEVHTPNLDLVAKPISDSRKRAALCVHAEKLAIAFGLLNTPQGQTLRITKNLKMCSNCHDATKIISKMERREIILRDNRCIHSFKNGSCSCLDMF